MRETENCCRSPLDIFSFFLHYYTKFGDRGVCVRQWLAEFMELTPLDAVLITGCLRQP